MFEISITLSMAWRNIWRNPRRTVLTMLAIGFGAVLLVFSIGLQLGQYDLMISSSVKLYHGLLQVQKAGYLEDPKMRNSIPDIVKLGQKLRDSTGLFSISARATGFALVSSDERTYGAMIVGVEPVNELKVSTLPGLIKQGRYLLSPHAYEIIIGKSLAGNMQIGIGDEVVIMGTGRDGSIAATILPVVGIYESGAKDLDRNLLQMPLLTFQEIFNMEGHGHSLVIYQNDVNTAHVLQQTIQNVLNDYDNHVVLRWDELQRGLKEMIELDYAGGWLMYIVLVAIITFSIMNTFLMSVLERTREFGIMIAIGYKPFAIGRLVMLEAFILTFIALIIGTGIGVLINLYFYHNGFTMPGMEEVAAQFNIPSYITPQMSIKSICLGPLTIFVATMLAALYPAFRIRSLQPVEAMRAI